MRVRFLPVVSLVALATAAACGSGEEHKKVQGEEGGGAGEGPSAAGQPPSSGGSSNMPEPVVGGAAGAAGAAGTPEIVSESGGPTAEGGSAGAPDNAGGAAGFPAEIVTLSAAELQFGDVSCGSPAAALPLTITNQTDRPVDFSVSFPVDTEGDEQLYSADVTSGVIGANAEVTLHVTRKAVALPALPRAYDAKLEIDIAGRQTFAVPLAQTLKGSLLEVDVTTIDFGFAPANTVLSHTIKVTNGASADVNATFSATGAQFSLNKTSATIGADKSASFNARYTGKAGTWTGSVKVTAPGVCNVPEVTLAAGTGPWASITNASFAHNCVNPAVTTRAAAAAAVVNPGSVTVRNLGTQPLQLSNCVETSNTDVDPQFAQNPAPIAANGKADVPFTWADPQPLHSGSTLATVTCDTNEKINTKRSFSVTRAIHGADLVIAPVDNFDFDCYPASPPTHYLKVTNEGDVAVPVAAALQMPSAEPLSTVGGFVQIDPNTSDTSLGVVYSGSTCSTQAGTVGLNIAGQNVCSVTPATLPVSTTFTPIP